MRFLTIVIIGAGLTMFVIGCSVDILLLSECRTDSDCFVEENPCLGVGECIEGQCQFELTDCDDGNSCTFDACAINLGSEEVECINEPLVCELLDNPCLENNCIDGECFVESIDCDDGNPCTVDFCIPQQLGSVNSSDLCNHVEIDNCLADIDTDLTDDGVINLHDLQILIDAWGRCAMISCPADFDGDGVVNIMDLNILVRSWTY
jgi:hypothetical protein